MAIIGVTGARAHYDVSEMMVLMAEQICQKHKDKVPPNIRTVPLRLISVSKNYLASVKRNFNGVSLNFEPEYTEFKTQHMCLRFTAVNDMIKFINLIRPRIQCVSMHSSRLTRREFFDVAEALVKNNLVSAESSLKCQAIQYNDNAVGTLLEVLGEIVGHVVIGDHFAPFITGNQYTSCKILGPNTEEVQYMPGYLKIGAAELDLTRASDLTDLMHFDVIGFPFEVSDRIKHLRVRSRVNVSQPDVIKAAELFRQHIPTLEKLTVAVDDSLTVSSLEHISKLEEQLNALKTIATSVPPHFSCPVVLEMHLTVEITRSASHLSYNIPKILEGFGQFHVTNQSEDDTSYVLQNTAPDTKNCQSITIAVDVKTNSDQPEQIPASDNEDDSD